MRPHQATPAPHMKGDNQRQPETTGDKTTSGPKKPTTPTNTHPPHEGKQPGQRETRHFRAQDGGHTNQHPPPHEGTQPETMGDNGRQRETRPLQSPRSRPHQPTPTPHMKGNNRRQRETRPLQGPRSRPHQPTPTPHMKGDNRRQRETRPLQSPRHPPHEGRQPETTGDKTTAEPKMAATPTNTHPHMKGDNRRQRETRPLQSPRSRPHQPIPTPQPETTRHNGRQDHFRAQEAHTNQNTPPT